MPEKFGGGGSEVAKAEGRRSRWDSYREGSKALAHQLGGLGSAVLPGRPGPSPMPTNDCPTS